MSSEPWAIQRVSGVSQFPGFTNFKREMPVFFNALAAAPIFPGADGSTSTTLILSSGLEGTVEFIENVFFKRIDKSVVKYRFFFVLSRIPACPFLPLPLNSSLRSSIASPSPSIYSEICIEGPSPSSFSRDFRRLG